jgi:hypothetical protein
MGAAGRLRAESFLAWEHQERSLLVAYARALEMGPVSESRRAILRRLLRGRRKVGNKAGGDSNMAAVAG